MAILCFQKAYTFLKYAALLNLDFDGICDRNDMYFRPFREQIHYREDDEVSDDLWRGRSQNGKYICSVKG